MKRILIALVALALAAAACGGSETAAGVASLEDSTATTIAGSDTGTDGDIDVEEAALAFTECLRDEGLDIEDPEFDGEGGFNFGQVFRGAAEEGEPGEGPGEEFLAAMEVCGELIEGVGQRFDRRDSTEFEDDLLAFAECMRDNGVDMADPDLSGDGGPGRGLLFALDMSDPAVEAALETCQSEFAFGGPGGVGGRADTGGDS